MYIPRHQNNSRKRLGTKEKVTVEKQEDGESCSAAVRSHKVNSTRKKDDIAWVTGKSRKILDEQEKDSLTIDQRHTKQSPSRLKELVGTTLDLRTLLLTFQFEKHKNLRVSLPEFNYMKLAE